MANLQTVTINNTDISIKEYQGKRVVALKENEAVKLIKLIQKLDKSEQIGVLMMINGTKIITETTFSCPRSEPPVLTFEEIP